MTQQADITDIVPTEQIDGFLIGAHFSTPVALQLAWTDIVDRGSGNNVQIASRDEVTTNAGTKAESADFALVSSTTDSVNVAGGWVGHSDEVSWESDTHGVRSSLEIVVVGGVEAVTDRIDVDGLTIGSGAAANTSFAGSNLTETRVLTFKAAYTAQRPHAGMKGLVLYTVQLRDWTQDLIASGGTHLGGDTESQRAADLMGFEDGFQGMRHKMGIFVSENVPTSAGNATGFVTNIGLGGALAYRSWAPLGWEQQWMPRGKLWEITVAANYGWVISDEDNIRGLTSQSV